MRRWAGVALAPVLRLAQASLEQAELSLPHPDGPPRAHASGINSVRILIVGDGRARGNGVRSHDLALPGAVARAVAARAGRGVDVELVAERRLPVERVARSVRGSHPSRHDVVVILAGSHEALRLLPAVEWRRRLSSALEEVRGLLTPGAGLVLAGIPSTFAARGVPRSIARLLEAHAEELNQVSAEVCAAIDGALFVPLGPARDASAHPAEKFAGWGEPIALAVTESICERAHAEAEADRAEDRRQAAVDRLGLANSEPDPRLRHIVELARRVFATESALFTVLDRDAQLHLAQSGTDVVQIPRGESFCQYTILDAGGMVVEDAQTDERFRDSPLVIGEPHVRFYAGFPVDSPDGERVGALCIFDTAPRRVDEVDMTLLRELSHLIQAELWRYLPVQATSDRGLRSVTRR